MGLYLLERILLHAASGKVDVKSIERALAKGRCK
jgi:hypothetical protein